MPFMLFNEAPTAAAPRAAAPTPPNLLEDPLMRAMRRQIEAAITGGGEDEALFTEIAKAAGLAQQEAGGARTAFESAARAPIPTTPPLADLVARSLGQLSSSLLGRQEPRELAEQTIKNEQARITARHAQEIELLANAYQKAADRASKLGDTEMEVKLREKIAKSREQQTEKISMLKLFMQERLAQLRETGMDERAQAAQKESFKRTIAASGFWFPEWGPQPVALPAAGGRYSGRTSGAKWPTIDQMADNWRQIEAKHTTKNVWGSPTGINKHGLRASILAGALPPPEEWRDNPDAYMEYLVNLTMPFHPDVNLWGYKKGQKRPPAFDVGVRALVKRYYPDYKF